MLDGHPGVGRRGSQPGQIGGGRKEAPDRNTLYCACCDETQGGAAGGCSQARRQFYQEGSGTGSQVRGRLFRQTMSL